MKTSARNAVRDALQRACADAPSPAQILFRCYFSASHIAALANVSASTAKRHLDALSTCRGYAKSTINGTSGYRYDSNYL